MYGLEWLAVYVLRGGCFGLFITWVAKQRGEWLHITLEWAHKHFFTRVEALFYFLHAMGLLPDT